jgi:PAS domain S-box-containing protein
MLTPPIIGIAITDARHRVLFGSGLGSDPRIQSLVADTAWMQEATSRRLNPLTLDRQNYIVLVTPTESGVLTMICQAPPALLEFISTVDFAFEIFERLLTDPFDGMTVVDDAGKVVYISPIHENFFGLRHGEANGRHVRQVIDNSRLDAVLKTGKAEVGAIQKMRGVERIVSRVPVMKGDVVVGAVGRVMFKGPEQVATLAARIKSLEAEIDIHKREVSALRRRTYGIDDLLGESEAMRRLRRDITKVAPLEIPILITGESGTGKELVAQAIHRLSPRRDSALVMLNAAALPATLVETELFGYEAGAFTGADKRGREGKFEQASEGTIFLDEIGDMQLEIQVKLLRVLQERTVERIGGGKPRQVDFRLISATNRDLHALIPEEKFRLDLYYRISPIVIQVPPLRSRVEDIELLAAHFLQEISVYHRRPTPRIDESAISYLMEQSWPGNIRQLRHEIERAFVFAEQDLITAETFLRDDQPDRPLPTVPRSIRERSEAPNARLRDAVGKTEFRMLEEALRSFNGNKKKAAEQLGISRSYLYKLLRDYG